MLRLFSKKKFKIAFSYFLASGVLQQQIFATFPLRAKIRLELGAIFDQRAKPIS
jgi:hypothetical protein